MGTSGEREPARLGSGAPPRVVKELERFAGNDGFVPFDLFMEVALYSPGVGYYDQPVSPIGPAGDFYTAPQVHPIFGATLGRHVARLLAAIEGATPPRIVELGPGNGELAAAVLPEVARALVNGPPLDYLLVEQSSQRGHTALQRAQRAAEGTRVRTRSIRSVGAEGAFAGVVIAHEVLDAQPLRRFRRAGTGWQELGIRLAAGGLVEAARPLSASDHPQGLPEDVEDGTVVELAPGGEGILRGIADHLARGRAIVVDYGTEGDEILRTHRFGTLTALRKHQVVEFPVEHAGTADLSAYVNFTRIRGCAALAGLDLVSDLSQAEALVAWGLSEVKERWDSVSDAEETLRTHLAVKNLLFGFPRFRALEFAPRSPRTT